MQDNQKPPESRPPGQAHIRADQSAALQFLANPASYAATEAGPSPSASESVERIDTHGAIVFLAGERAYKIKRAVRYPYMDFSTLERRRWACEREHALNTRTAPGLYLQVIAITRDRQGVLSFKKQDAGQGDRQDDDQSEVVEWVLVMRRFRQDQLLSNLAKAGGLTDDIMAELADAIAAFHGAAPAVEADKNLPLGTKAMEWVVLENNEEFAERNDLFPAAKAAQLAEQSLAHLARHRALLDERAAAGRQRFCHGDLHLRNVVLLDGHPVLFDAIEFNDAIACVDVLYDLAFLLMDLEHRGLRPPGNLVFNRYLQTADELDGVALLPLFLSVRAAVRAKVAASLQAVAEDAEQRMARSREALAYFEEALTYLAPAPPRLVAVGGLSGSGKTSLARLLAPELGAAPGALHLRSDVLRKTLAGVGETVRLPEAAYSRAAGDAVYRAMLDKAQLALKAGQSVIMDAVFARAEERAAVEQAARNIGVPFTGLWLQAAPETLTARVEARRNDASDATAAVVEQQLSYELGQMDWTSVETVANLSTVAQICRKILGLS